MNKDHLSMTRESVIDNARIYVTRDRNKDYRDPEDNFLQTAELWNFWLRDKLKDGCEITPADVGILMVFLKVARLKGNPYKVDTLEDIIGYTACAAECLAIEKLRSDSDETGQP